MNKINEISASLARVRDEKLIEDFLKSILTKKEIADISARWALVKLLDMGLSQRAVSKKLGVSLCKITRGSKELKKRKSAFKQLIDQFNRIKK